MVYVVLSCGCGCEGSTVRFFTSALAELREKTENPAWVRGLWPEVVGPLYVGEMGEVPATGITVDESPSYKTCSDCGVVYPEDAPEGSQGHEKWCSVPK